MILLAGFPKMFYMKMKMVVKSAVRSRKYVAMRTVQGCELNIPVNCVSICGISWKKFIEKVQTTKPNV